MHHAWPHLFFFFKCRFLSISCYPTLNPKSAGYGEASGSGQELTSDTHCLQPSHWDPEVMKSPDFCDRQLCCMTLEVKPNLKISTWVNGGPWQWHSQRFGGRLESAVTLSYRGDKLLNTLWLFLSFFETKSIVSQAGPHLAIQLRMTLNFCSSYFHPSNAGVTGMCHTPVYIVLGMEPRASWKKIFKKCQNLMTAQTSPGTLKLRSSPPQLLRV